MKYTVFILFLIFSCSQKTEKSIDKKVINQTIDTWHKAASEAHFDTYFSLMTQDARFLGTAAEENWSKDEFMQFSKPFFDKGKAWDFKVLDRNVYTQNNSIWFDERLDTWMGICRGSGVLVQENKHWKIKHYVLSLLIPNETVNRVKKLNDSINKTLLFKLKK